MARFDKGWVKIHRKAILGDIGANYLRGGLFMSLIAMANLKPSTVSWRGKPRRLDRGELVTSIRELAELGEVDRKSVQRHLNYLVLRETIVVEKCFGGTFIKIPNFDKYQIFDAEGSQVNPISGDSDVPNEGTHIEERKNKRSSVVVSSAERFEARFHPEAQKFLEGLKVMGVDGGLKNNLAELIQRFEKYDEFKEWANALLASADKKEFQTKGERARWIAAAVKSEIGAGA